MRGQNSKFRMKINQTCKFKYSNGAKVARMNCSSAQLVTFETIIRQLLDKFFIHNRNLTTRRYLLVNEKGNAKY